MVALKTGLYAGIVSFFVLAAPRLVLLFPGFLHYHALERRTEPVTLGFSLATTLVVLMLLQASALVASSEGEIYQYVGDEMVVTWTEAEGRTEARPLRCFFRMEEALRARRAQFAAQFAVEPGLPDVHCRDLGALALRGRKEPIRASAVSGS